MDSGIRPSDIIQRTGVRSHTVGKLELAYAQMCTKQAAQLRHPSGFVADCLMGRLGSQIDSFRLEMEANPQIQAP
ncbi:MAG: hypothetical protein AAF824_15345 [Bacteroidota bacterium]